MNENDDDTKTPERKKRRTDDRMNEVLETKGRNSKGEEIHGAHAEVKDHSGSYNGNGMCGLCNTDGRFECVICDKLFCKDHYSDVYEICRECLSCEKCGRTSLSYGGEETISVCVQCNYYCCRKHLWKDEYEDECCYDCFKASEDEVR